MWPFRRKNKITLDAAGHDPKAAKLRQWLIDRDWRSARNFLNTVTNPDDRYFYLRVCADVPGIQEWITDWVAAEPTSTLPLLVRGCHGISWAWEARSGARAKDVSADAFRVFRRRLKMAEDCLDEVVARTPDDVTAWAYLVISARGRQVGKEETQRRFKEVVSRHPHHLGAHTQMLQFLCRKWYGSHDEMFAFARNAAESAPDGSLLPVLVADAHIEMWLDQSDEESVGYLVRPEVRAELRQAAKRSIWHPAYRHRPGWPGWFNTFAMAFWLADDNPSAAAVFDVLGDRVTRSPWSYSNQDVVTEFQQAREWVLNHRHESVD